MTGDGVIDLTPDGSDVTLPMPPRALTVAPEPEPAAQPAATVELRGRRFPIRAQGIALLSLMKFATIAKRGQIDSEDLEGLVALYDLLRSCIAADAWDEFERHADDVGATGEELIVVVKDAIEAATARPTQPPSLSPGGQPTTGPSSAAGSSSPGLSTRQGSIEVQRRYEQAGRADIAQVIKRAREASTTSSTG